jgi:cytochrome c-type biogenesis protein CcmH/NrfF
MDTSLSGLPQGKTTFARLRLAARFACALLALAGPMAAWAQEQPVQDDRRFSLDVLRRERALSSEIMSPFCPGRTMVSCTSDQARSWREVFKGYLANGVSEDEIKQQFRTQYGELTRGTPSGALGWSIPIVVLLVGGATLAYALRRFRANASDLSAPDGPASAASRELEAELDRQIKARGL